MGERVTQRRKVLRRRHLTTKTRSQSFKVTERRQGWPHILQNVRRTYEFSYGIMPRLDRRNRQQRIAQPGTEQPSAHWRQRIVNDIDEGFAARVRIRRAE